MGTTIIDKFRRGLLIALSLGILVYLAYALWAGWDEVASALASFNLRWLPLLLLLSLGNYGIRYLRWEMYLRTLSIKVAFTTSLAIFLAGLAMTITPGKVGEFLKSYLLKKSAGIPMATSAPVVLAERITDLLSLLLLASFGVASYGGAQGMLVLVAAATLVLSVLVVLQSRPLTQWALSVLAKLPVGAQLAPKIEELLSASRSLLGLRPLALGLLLATVAWFCECLGYYWAFDAFPDSPGLELSVAVFAYSFSTVAGVVSPGGIGPTDIGLIELACQFTEGLSERRDLAAAASFVVRICTLWFAVLLGAVALMRFRSEVEIDVDVARSGAEL